LADMTKVALSILEKNPKGFFVMIEGGRIDHACHAHDIKAAIYETLAFDAAVNVALEYQKAHPDALVLVTADHETGGLGLGRGTDYALDLAALKPIKNSLEYLTIQMKKDPARFDGLLQSAGFEFTDKEKALLSKYPHSAGTSEVTELNQYPKIDGYVLSWIHYALGSIESERAKIGWTSFVHTAQPVITYAVGPGEKEFAGFYDNTDIAKKIAKLLGVPLEQPASSCEAPVK
jgi:alkaline phosphatase